MFPKIGDVYYVEFRGDNSEQRGMRPAVVIQNNIGNKRSPNLTVIPLTSQNKPAMITHVKLDAGKCGLPTDSTALCENEVTISKSKVGKFLTSLPIGIMAELAKAHCYANPLIGYIDDNELRQVKNKAIQLCAI